MCWHLGLMIDLCVLVGCLSMYGDLLELWRVGSGGELAVWCGRQAVPL